MRIYVDTEEVKQSSQARINILATLIKKLGYTVDDFTSAFLVAKQMPDNQQDIGHA